MGSGSQTVVDLGVLQPSPRWKLTSRFLTNSKVGGKPAWLQPQCLPAPEELQCSICSHPMVFVMQLYAPIDESIDAFHRSLFVFMCKNGPCHNHSSAEPPFAVFRNQLGRSNPFYPYDPPQEQKDWRPDLTVSKWCSLCRICGCMGSKACAGCKKITYCSRQHQTMDWKLRHKNECSDPDFQRNPQLEETEHNPFLLPEWEIKMVEEDTDTIEEPSDDDDSDQESDTEECANNDELNRFLEMQRKGQTGAMSDEDLNQFVGEVGAQESGPKGQFKRFLRVTKKVPGQVVRYSRGGSALWVHEEQTPEEIPACQVCKEPRVFEFQILPQLLASLKLDDSIDGQEVDWGTVAVFCCRANCRAQAPAYAKEFIWRQRMPSQ